MEAKSSHITVAALSRGAFSYATEYARSKLLVSWRHLRRIVRALKTSQKNGMIETNNTSGLFESEHKKKSEIY